MKPKHRPRAAAPVISVTTQGGPFAGVSAATLRRRAAKMLHHLALGDVELSVALVDDATIRALNRTYRRKNKPTDVLAFAMTEEEGAVAELGPRGPLDPAAWRGILGDVILSVETAGRQARQRGRPLLDELTMLLGHGLLHLLGYDHRTDGEEQEMTAMTRELEAAAAAAVRRTAPGRASRRAPVRASSRPER